MTGGLPRAGARSGQLRRIAQRRARSGQAAGRRTRAPLGARRPGHRSRAPERNGGAARAAGGPPADAGGWWQRAGLVATMLPGLAAVATLVFTWVSVTQVSEELTISEQGQIADRYDKAIERLDDDSANIRRGAIFSLQGIMEDSPRQQPAVIYDLSQYIRTHASKKAASADKAPDLQAALSVLGQRDPGHDGDRAVDLRGVQLAGVDLKGADLSGANLAGAVFSHGDLEGTKLSGADLHGASLNGANLHDADLSRAILYKTNLRDADLTEASLGGADLAAAELAGAYLTDVRVDGATEWTGAHRPEGDLPTVPASPTPRESRANGGVG
ncbi:pentapeptide repeat-containing protein [Streptomyces sp. NPDC046881]|uniref:pentapeptide repeat-containing protein n=1 Tax=Streptomyces sp. NPDC046881 TaxID=3155374 RepID=UPI003411CB19